jgi:hypothetical protein
MTAGRRQLARAAGFALVTLVLAVTQPMVLVGVPLALLLLAWGPRNAASAALAGGILAASLLGSRSGLWWFERGWPLLLAGIFVWVSAWRRDWGFTSRALAALGLAALVAGAIFAASPHAWQGIDALMAERAARAADATLQLLGGSADERIRWLADKVAALQVAVFPALVGVSSLAALGLAESLRTWLAGARSAFGELRSFRFNDHLVWIWLLGLVLVLAQQGDVATRIGGNAVLFMGALYVLRGMAVVLAVLGGVSPLVGVLSGVIALLLAPVLALALALLLIVGLGDTWFNVRSRVAAGGK